MRRVRPCCPPRWGDANLLVEGAPYPRGQVILEKNRFVCEYYPDITTMEVYKQRIYRYTGKQVQKPTTKKLKFGAACYAERVGDYMFRMQAHSEDESDASPYRTVKISHIASGKQKTLYLYDWSFCAFPDADGNLLFAQQNERGNLEIRQYSASMQETIVELDSSYFDDNLSYVSSAACIESTAYLLISQGFSKYTLLTYDREAQKSPTAEHSPQQRTAILLPTSKPQVLPCCRWMPIGMSPCSGVSCTSIC